MKKLLFLFLFWPLFSHAQTQAQTQVQTPVNTNDLRIMSYNIRVGKGMDQVNSLQRIADVICLEQPHVVALQEVDSATIRTGGVDQIKELAKLTGMYSAFAPAIAFSGGKYGVGLLSLEEPISIKKVPLPGREEPRVLLIVEFRDYVVASTHFSLTEADRLASAEILLTEAAQVHKPMFICGDFNALPTSPSITRLSAPATLTNLSAPATLTLLSDPTAPTFPADHPTECIDYIFGKSGTSPNPGQSNNQNAFKFNVKFNIIKQVVIPESVASDHRPIMVVISKTPY